MKNWPKEDRIEAFYDFMRGTMPREKLEMLARSLEAMGFFTAPASTKYHGSYEGGGYSITPWTWGKTLCI